ncbi:MAG: hypothetical protein J0L72_02890 [Armatimonadetes bacterium]|nr:hypothetical protein [Armatimonadota bacterium]
MREIDKDKFGDSESVLGMPLPQTRSGFAEFNQPHSGLVGASNHEVPYLDDSQCNDVPDVPHIQPE